MVESEVLVCIDGMAELLASQGRSENDPADILSFFREYIRPFAETGAAVLISDHVAKDAETRGRWSRGSGAKLGRYDGAVYHCKLVEGYSPTKAGSVKLVVSKDRNGGVGPQGTVAAHIHFEPLEEGGTLASIKQPPANFKPTFLMDKIVTELTVNPEAGLRDLRQLGKSQYINEAIKALQDEGKLTVIKQGPGKPNRYELT